jgi:hypothetical protein
LADQVLAPSGTDTEAVEGDVEVDVFGAGDQAVVSNNLDLGFGGGIGRGGGGSTVNRSKHHNFDTLGDKCLKVGFFLG